MTRRELFPAMAAAAVVPPALPALAAEISPVRAKFEEWKPLFAVVNDSATTDDERNRQIGPLCDLENEIYRTPAQDAEDLALKVLVLAHDTYLDGCDEAACFLSDARAILGPLAEV